MNTVKVTQKGRRTELDYGAETTGYPQGKN